MIKAAKFVIPVGILITGGLLMMLFLNMRSSEPKHAPKTRPRVVDVVSVEPGPVQTHILAYGHLISAQPVDLISEVAGKLINGKKPFRPGTRFSKGQLLFKIDERQARYSLNAAKADLMAALASVLPDIKLDFPNEYPIWQRYFDGCDFESELSKLPESENSKLKLFLSRFGVFRKYFSVLDLAVRLEKHYFFAPYDGAVVNAGLRAGANARVGAVVGAIVNLEEIEVELPIALGDVNWIEAHKEVDLYSIELDSHFKGDVVRLGSSIDQRTQTVTLYVNLNDDSRESIISGTFVQAQVPGKIIDNAVVIPRSAIQNEKYVYTVSDAKLRLTEVTIARLEIETAIINGGLNPGDTVVVQALQGVVPGEPTQCRSISDEGTRR